MPYITADARARLKSPDRPARNVGELTYVLQQVVDDYLNFKGLSYQSLAETLGALEGLKLDVNRRLLAPYEQNKQRENGEAWSLSLRARANGTV